MEEIEWPICGWPIGEGAKTWCKMVGEEGGYEEMRWLLVKEDMRGEDWGCVKW